MRQGIGKGQRCHECGDKGVRCGDARARRARQRLAEVAPAEEVPERHAAPGEANVRRLSHSLPADLQAPYQERYYRPE